MILIVEDNPEMATIFAKVLAGSGWEVIAVGTGEAAMDSLSAGPIELVLVDLALPDMDGVEFARRAKNTGCDVPMIAVSGALQLIDQSILKSVGFVAWLSKPLRVTELVNLVREHARTVAVAAGPEPAGEP